MKAVRVHTPGGSHRLIYEDVPTPEPGPGEVQVRIEAVGVNFREVYVRQGIYPEPLPIRLGREAAGRISALGAGVTGLRVGDPVCYCPIAGAYAEVAVIPAERAVPLVPGVDTRQAAAVILQGMTAHYLAHDSFPLGPGQTCLIQAGAGGLGLLLTQMAHNLGARVITTVSGEEKAALSRKAGADHVILYTRSDFGEETLRYTGGEKLDVVYDSVGQTTFFKGLELVKPQGTFILCGNSSGKVPPVNLRQLSGKGSITIHRPGLTHFISTREALIARAHAVLGMVADGSVTVNVWKTYPLAEAAAAHDDLESRRTVGKLLLIP